MQKIRPCILAEVQFRTPIIRKEIRWKSIRTCVTLACMHIALIVYEANDMNERWVVCRTDGETLVL